MHNGKKPNRLIHEKSPYLLQHAHNPVDWYPWGEEAFKKARDEDKPIFLSVGYSTCYWCHVMAREDFENPEIADIMNKNFVSIKVDREERPDVDRIYMTAVQAISGSGGWPMSVFLTPDLKPFFGGTYFPPTPQMARPGFPQILEHISNLWKNDRQKIFDSGNQITDYLKQQSSSSSSGTVSDALLDSAYKQFVRSYDIRFGGFGSGTKFPQPVTFNFLLRYHARTKDQFALQMTLTTLRKMAEGGVYDHIGGGFHRYSVDERWRVPHFEKMLYDQAQLASSYLDAYQLTHDEFYVSVARDIFSYVLRNMTHRDGGFYSAEDAESAIDASKPDEKEEGEFYVWTKSEIEKVLGTTDAAIFNFYYGVQDSGNALRDPMNVFAGKNILYTAHTLEETGKQFNKTPHEIQKLFAEARKKLFAEREKRPKPHLDDKIITAWNGLMISAFAKGYQILDEQKYLQAAEHTAEFITTKLYGFKTHKLLRRYRDGEARFNGTLQDYAFFTQGLLDLYEASFDIKWLELANDLTKKQNELFWDTANGGFFDTELGDPSLLIRTKEDYDGAEPTGNSVAALNLLRLSQMTDNKEWHKMVEKTIAAFGARLQQLPHSMAQMLVALDWIHSTPKEIVIAGEPNSYDTKTLLKEVHSHFIPNKIVLLADGANGQKRLSSFLPFVEGMAMLNGKATAYICENYACQLPTTERAVAAKLLTKTSGR